MNWCELSVATYSALIRDRVSFAQAAYRDGQWYFMLGKKGTNINGETYTPELGRALLETLRRPVGQWCVFWWPHPKKIGSAIRAQAVRWIGEHKPDVLWIPDRPIGKAVEAGSAAPFFRACQARRVVLVGPQHLAKLALFEFEHVVCPDGTAWQQVDRLASEVLALHQPQDLVLFSAGHASNLLIHRLWPRLKGHATLYDIGATLDPFCGVMSRGAFREPGWAEEVMPRNIP